VTDSVYETTIDATPVSAVSPATDTDREDYYEQFPVASEEEVYARNEMMFNLNSVRQSIAEAKVDYVYDKEELANLQQQVSEVISNYSSFQFKNYEVDKSALSLVSEMNSYYALAILSMDARLSAAANTALMYQPKIDQLEYRVGLLEGN
jgi:hypothetical protein